MWGLRHCREPSAWRACVRMIKSQSAGCWTQTGFGLAGTGQLTGRDAVIRSRAQLFSMRVSLVNPTRSKLAPLLDPGHRSGSAVARARSLLFLSASSSFPTRHCPVGRELLTLSHVSTWALDHASSSFSSSSYDRLCSPSPALASLIGLFARRPTQV